jgi:hypothetical protein
MLPPDSHMLTLRCSHRITRDSNELAPLARGAFSFKARCPSLVVSGVLNSFRDRSASAHETSGRIPEESRRSRNYGGGYTRSRCEEGLS